MLKTDCQEKLSIVVFSLKTITQHIVQCQKQEAEK